MGLLCFCGVLVWGGVGFVYWFQLGLLLVPLLLWWFWVGAVGADLFPLLYLLAGVLYFVFYGVWGDVSGSYGLACVDVYEVYAVCCFFCFVL